MVIDQQMATWVIDQLDPGESLQARIYTTILAAPPDDLFANEAFASGPEGTITSTAEVTGVTTLPSTGYPPQRNPHSDRIPITISLILIGGLCGLTLIAVRRRFT